MKDNTMEHIIKQIVNQVTLRMGYDSFKNDVVKLATLGVAKKDLIQFINDVYDAMEEEKDEGQLEFRFEEE